MPRLLCLTVLLFGPLGSSVGQTLKEEHLARIKAATVFIKVRSGGAAASGSGFLVHVAADAGYIVSNHHVVDLSDDARMSGDGAPLATLQVVFNSGTTAERVLPAVLVAADPDRDLAVLRVTAPNLPVPFDVKDAPAVRETMKVFVCGFPFGGRLSAGDKNPEISIGEASVSSIRREVVDGPVTQIQLNGALNPGNSGGPIVADDGKLVGVAVKTVRAAGIGFAIPQHEVVSVLRGKVGRVALTPPTGDSPTAKLTVDVIDPLKTVKSVTAHVLPRTATPTMPATPSALPGAMKYLLTISNGIASAEVPLPAGSEKAVLLQLEIDVTAGKLFTNAGIVPVTADRPRAAGPDSRRAESLLTPDGKLKRAGGSLLLPFPTGQLPPGSDGINVSVVNAAPQQHVNKTLRVDCLTTCAVTPSDKGEYELNVETDAENPPAEMRVLLPKDLGLQVADLGIPELVNVVLQIKYAVRVVGKLTKPVGRDVRHVLMAESIEFLGPKADVVVTLKPQSAPPSGPPTWSAVNRFPDQYVGQSIILDGTLSGTRYAGGTGLKIGNTDAAPPINLDVYTSRQLASAVDSDIAKIDLPGRAKFTFEVKAVNPRTGKGVVGISKVELLDDAGKVTKTLTGGAIEYPAVPTKTADKPKDTPAKPAEKPTEKPADAVVTPPPPAGSNTPLLIGVGGGGVGLLAAAAYVLTRKSCSAPAPGYTRPTERSERTKGAESPTKTKPRKPPNGDNPFADLS